MIEMEIKKRCKIHEGAYLIVDSVKVFTSEFGSYQYLRSREIENCLGLNRNWYGARLRTKERDQQDVYGASIFT